MLSIARSKTNQTGAQPELVVIPHGGHPRRCPVTALSAWLDGAAITTGPVFRPVSKGNHALNRRLHPESVNTLVRNAIRRAGTDPAGYSAHSLRGGFVTRAHLRGAPPTAPSPTKPATAPWPPSAPTSASTPHGTTTPPLS